MRTSPFFSLLSFLSLLAAASGCAGNSPPALSAAPPSAAVVPSSAPAAKPELPPISSDFPREWASQRGYSLGEPSQAMPTEDGRYVFFLRATPPDVRSSLWEIEVATGKTRELIRPDTLVGGGEEVVSAEEKARRERTRTMGGGLTSFEAKSDGSVLIVGFSGRLFAWTRATGKARELATGDGVIDPHLSPDGTKVAYVRNNDVYVVPVGGGKESAVTRGGTETNPHGLAEFMAQEEFARRRGFWWSPDGREIVYEDADVSKLPKWTLADPANPATPPQIVAYPKVGAPHAIVRLAIAKVGAPGAPPRKINWDAARYPYLYSVVWSKNAPLTLHVRDRALRHAQVVAIDPATGGARELVTEEDPVWLENDPTVPRWLPDGSAFLWSTERNGAWELELRDRSGKKMSTVAPAAMGYRWVRAVDAEKNVAYVAASTEPIRTEVWAVPLAAGGAPAPVFRNTDATINARFGDSARVFAFTEGSTRGERRFGVRSVDGKVDIPIASAAKSPPFLPNIEYTTIGKDAYRVALVRPRNFDPKRRYPVIDSIYGAPAGNVVRADAKMYLENQWLADTVQAIVVSIDAKASLFRGRDWTRAASAERFAFLPIDMHAEALADLGKKYPELDVSRVGITGWSAGGYYTAMATLRRPDVFKAGVAGAIVADLKDYDAIFEYIIGPENSPNFNDASLLTWASRPPTATSPPRPLLLIHGTADDNTYFVHALKFAEAMGRGGRPLEFLPILGGTHIPRPDTTVMMWSRTAQHFRDHL